MKHRILGMCQKVQCVAAEVSLMQTLLAAGWIGVEVSWTIETPSAATGLKSRVESLLTTDMPASVGLMRPNMHRALQGESWAV